MRTERRVAGLTDRMPLRHALLALAVVAVWGSNFVVIKEALSTFPPFLFAALRFGLSFLPWIFFVRRPAVRWRVLALFGALQGGGQFGLLYYAMRGDISPGLASLVVQSQVFFTVGAAVLFLNERIDALRLLALALAGCGIGVIAWHGAFDGSAAVTLTGLFLTLGAGLSWALSNLLARSAGRVDALGFMVWSCPFGVPPLIVLSLCFDPRSSQLAAMAHAGLGAWSAVLWQAVGNTLFGFGAWNWLLARHPSTAVAPMALLVPVFGFGASALLLGEALPAWKAGAAGLILVSLVLNVLASRPSTGIARVGGPQATDRGDSGPRRQRDQREAT